MSYRTHALVITLVLSSFLVASYNGKEDSNTHGKRFDIATVANAAVVSQGKSVRCKNALTQREIDLCFQEYFKKADAELNKVYKRIIGSLSPTDSADNRANLTEAQRAWLKYRNANCFAEREMYHGGSIAPTIEAGCLEAVTIARTKELIRIYETDANR